MLSPGSRARSGPDAVLGGCLQDCRVCWITCTNLYICLIYGKMIFLLVQSMGLLFSFLEGK